METTTRLVGLDLGQASDFTALAVLERRDVADGPASYGCRHLERFHLGTPYPTIVSAVAKMFDSPALLGAPLVVDGTGVGRAVVDMFSLVHAVR
jgi:hypothetical protein